MGYGDEGSTKYSFISFVISVLGFFLFSVYNIGAVLGVLAILLSFAAEYLRERSLFQYLAIIIAVVDIIGAVAGWNLIYRAT